MMKALLKSVMSSAYASNCMWNAVDGGRSSAAQCVPASLCNLESGTPSGSWFWVSHAPLPVPFVCGERLSDDPVREFDWTLTMPAPLVTVLIDTYNHERYIEQTLVSVLEQGLSSAELEIVVVDDGSTDKTPEIIRKFAPRVKHVRKANGGQASAFNAGFVEAHGEIVATLDGDDWWAKGKVNAVVSAMEANPSVAAVSHGYYEFHEDTQEAKLCLPPEARILSIDTPDAIHEALITWPYLLMGALTLRRRVM